MEANEAKKKRRSKADSEGRSYTCECGKSYFSYQALYTHKKTKHSESISVEDLPKKKRGRPRLNKPSMDDEPLPNLVSNNDPITNIMKTWNETEKSGTCDEIFAEFLIEKQGKLPEDEYKAAKASVYNLRDCINKNYERLDAENFLEYESEYTVCEKPGMIPNISNFYIIEFLPKEISDSEKDREIQFMLEFCKWLNENNYTDLEIAISS